MTASWTGRVDRIAAALADRLNPIVVKEVRQSLKGRAFLAWFLFVVSVGGIIALGAAQVSSTSLDPNVGRDVFLTYVGFFSFLSLAVVPMTSFLALSQEMDDGTLELVSITALGPGQIVRGKLASTLIQASLYTSALLPFMAFTFFLRGIDIISIASCLALIVLASVLLSALSLWIAAIIPIKRVRLVAGAALGLGLMGAAISAVPVAEEMLRDRAVQEILDELRRRPEGWWGVAGAAFMYVTFVALFVVLAIRGLTFEAANRSTPVRVLIAFQFLSWTAMTAGAYLNANREPAIVLLSLLCGLCYAWLVGLFVATESEHLSRRVRLAISRGWRRLRFPLAMFLPGGNRGFVFALACGGLIAVTGLGLLLVFPPASYSRVPDLEHITSLCALTILYAWIYLALPLGIARWVRPRAGAIALRVGVVLFLFLGLISPLFAFILGFEADGSGSMERLLALPCPPLAFDRALQAHGLDQRSWLALGAVAGLALLLNLPRLWLAFRLPPPEANHG